MKALIISKMNAQSKKQKNHGQNKTGKSTSD